MFKGRAEGQKDCSKNTFQWLGPWIVGSLGPHSYGHVKSVGHSGKSGGVLDGEVSQSFYQPAILLWGFYPMSAIETDSVT